MSLTRGHEEITPAEVGCLPLWDSNGVANDNKPLTDITYTFNKFVRAAVRAVLKQQIHTFRYISVGPPCAFSIDTQP